MQRMKKTKGGALLTALFIMTIVAIVATAMAMRLQLDIYRTRLIVTHDKMYLASQAISFWALGELNNPKNLFSQQNALGMVGQFPVKLSSIYKQIEVSGALYDLQALYNLNNLSDKSALPNFILLEKAISSKNNDVNSKNLGLAINNWLTPYDLALGQDSYTAYYLSQNPPYYPAHYLMQSYSELRLIKDLSPAKYQALSKYTTVLPDSTPININTASKEVLLSLGNGINDQRVHDLIQARGDTGFKNIKDIDEVLKKMNIPPEQITIESQYFLSIARVKSDTFNMTVYTLLKRIKNRKDKLNVGIIRESINNF